MNTNNFQNFTGFNLIFFLRFKPERLNPHQTQRQRFLIPLSSPSNFVPNREENTLKPWAFGCIHWPLQSQQQSPAKMARLLHSLCFPSTTFFSLLVPPNLSSLPPIYNLSISALQFKPTSLTLRRAHRFRSISCSSSALTTPEDPSVESNEEEVSSTRLLAQNVPWTSTADDIRALFEKHGTVLDVQVCCRLFCPSLIFFGENLCLFSGLLIFRFIWQLSMHNKTRNRGLAFVEMGSAEEAAQALAMLEAYVSILLSLFLSLGFSVLLFINASVCWFGYFSNR